MPQCAALIILLSMATSAYSQLPKGVTNDQNPNDKTISPQESLKRIRVPEGFQVRLFAGEPTVAQPIAADFDDRGRLWVVECYSHPNWRPEGNDRILIFEDTDQDGTFDRRKVFWDKGRYLTGLAFGHGGVWICNTPSLMFIPDADRDDVPDGPPVELLDGWTRKNPHNVLNNLIWGPDGWLYGCIGNSQSSYIGPPGSKQSERTRISRGIWRYHPSDKRFEVVGEGAVNPWGLDFDEHGQGFFTNCVLGHLWHLIPGAYYERRGVEKDNPFAYSRIAPISDHLHWGGGRWTSSRGGKGAHNVAGGGHAHTGAMIYLGDNWPKKYRNTFFTGNIHGNRTNNDVLLRHGSGFVGKHRPDFLQSQHDWFRCLWQKYGPDGGVYFGDWHDFGECHDNDGSHRTSGRIYKVTYGQPRPVPAFDLAQLDDGQLLELLSHDNEWYPRRARRLLHERARAGNDMRIAQARLRAMFVRAATSRARLQALWALYVTDGASVPFLRAQLEHEDEHVRAWAIRLLVDRKQPTNVTSLERLASNEKSAFVRLHLASALNRLAVRSRWGLAKSLLTYATDEGDHNLPHLIWYGVAPLWEDDQPRYLSLLQTCRIQLVRQHMARRAATAGGLPRLVQLLPRMRDATAQIDVLTAIERTVRGAKLREIASWSPAYAELRKSTNPKVRRMASSVGLALGDRRAGEYFRAALMNANEPVEHRRKVLQALVDNQVEGVSALLHRLLAEPEMRLAALRGLGSFRDPETPAKVLGGYQKLSATEKQAALDTLASRATYAGQLLDAIEGGRVPRSDVTAFTARQMRNLGNKKVTERLRKIWGEVRTSSNQKRKTLARYKRMLSGEGMQGADRAHGRAVYNATCLKCHKLFGEGGTIGPDLTGSNRHNLDYILENVVDPSAVVARDFQMIVVETEKGRVVTGLVVSKTDEQLVLQAADRRVVIAASDVALTRVSANSMMPEGQLDKLDDKAIRDLIAYLAAPMQVKLPQGVEQPKIEPQQQR